MEIGKQILGFVTGVYLDKDTGAVQYQLYIAINVE